MVILSALSLATVAAAPALIPQEGKTRRAREEAAYPVTTLEPPPGVALEVGGLALVPQPGGDDRVVCVTRRGEVWGVDGFANAEPNAAASVSKIGEGLHEPLGLLPDARGLLSACRGELLRIEDTDGDGTYETQVTIGQGWQLSGNYHEYNFGPARSADGSYWITTNKPFGDQPFGKVEWRGYALRITPDGDVKPMCAGLRSPAGVEAAPWGEVFYTDNQGEWCGASKLSLLSPGSYHGHPHGIASTEDPAWTFKLPKALPDGETYAALAATGDYPTLQMPTVWFPYDAMGRSPAGFVWDETGGRFGPFGGQIFVGDQYEAAVFRVDIERVKGHWQGMCVRFREGLACGVTRLAWTKGGALLCGETDRGWGSKGPLTDGLQRIDWSGETPFEIQTMRLNRDGSGFTLRFTEPVDRQSASEATSYSMESFTYAATARYGSPELDRGTPEVTAATLHADGKGVDLVVEGMREGYVHALHADGVFDRAGEQGLLHPDVYYTLVKRW